MEFHVLNIHVLSLLLVQCTCSLVSGLSQLPTCRTVRIARVTCRVEPQPDPERGRDPCAGGPGAAAGLHGGRAPGLPGKLEKTRVFFNPAHWVFWVFRVFLGYLGFFCFLKNIFAQKREFLGFFQFQEYRILGASRR
jgi:hypothetical protein